MMPSPFFIIGTERSGTTLLRLILNTHSRLAVPEEVGYFGFDFSQTIDVTQWENPGLSWEEYEQYVHNFLSSRKETFKDFELQDLEDTILKNKEINLKKPYQTSLSQFARLHGKQRWGEKTPNNVFFVDILYQMFPKAKFIHIVRDPRSIVCSMNQDDFPWFSDDSVINALNWRKKFQAAKQLLEKNVPSEQRMLIRYEDLVANPEVSVKQICSFLNEAFEPDMLQFYRTSKEFMLKSANNSHNRMANNPISTESLKRWEKNLKASDIFGIDSICRKELKKLGYTSDLGKADIIQHFLIWFKQIYWYWHSWLHRSTRGYVMQHKVFILERLKHRRFRLSDT
ncbi:MAG: sulfotransferase [Cyanobacteria bacterium J06560_6]